MGRPIKLTPEMIEDCIQDLRAKLAATNMFEGKVKYETTFDYKSKDENGNDIPDIATVVFSQGAYAKQQRLVQDFTTEVAWHGVVHRDENDPSKFHIDDIIVFPQTVTGATVTPDQKEYEMWLMKLPDDQFNHCRYHGHSHVNMGTSPSGTDDNCQKDILGRITGDGFTEEEKLRLAEELGENAFYVFMIWNKRGEHHVRIFDLWTNTFYEEKDVRVEIEGQDNLGDFMADAKEKVKTHTYTTPTYNYSSTPKTNPAIPGQTAIGFQSEQSRAAHIRYPYDYDEYPRM